MHLLRSFPLAALLVGVAVLGGAAYAASRHLPLSVEGRVAGFLTSIFLREPQESESPLAAQSAEPLAYVPYENSEWGFVSRIPADWVISLRDYGSGGDTMLIEDPGYAKENYDDLSLGDARPIAQRGAVFFVPLFEKSPSAANFSTLDEWMRFTAKVYEDCSNCAATAIEIGGQPAFMVRVQRDEGNWLYSITTLRRGKELRVTYEYDEWTKERSGVLDEFIRSFAFTDTATSSAPSLRTVENAKTGWRIKIPADWSVGEERTILSKPNKIVSYLEMKSPGAKRAVTVQVDAWPHAALYIYESSLREEVQTKEGEQVAYVFPRGYECYERAENPDLDCSFFAVPFSRGFFTYTVRGRGEAATIDNTYASILASFDLAPFSKEFVLENLSSLPPEIQIMQVKAVEHTQQRAVFTVLLRSQGGSIPEETPLILSGEAPVGEFLFQTEVASVPTGAEQWRSFTINREATDDNGTPLPTRVYLRAGTAEMFEDRSAARYSFTLPDWPDMVKR